jgi:SWI/SNF-related matrix-associated actin-dependent regulator 1 of chromatin subfamily A
MNELLPFQVDGVAFAATRPRVLIADEMGLGKTIQAISVINTNHMIRCVLIICPASLKRNWEEKMATWLTRHVAYSITNFERLSAVSPVGWDLVIVDEAHLIKNEDTARCVEVQRVSAEATFIIALTGTPIESRPAEFFTLLSWLDPKEWGEGKRARALFHHRYCKPFRVVTNPGLHQRSGGRYGSRLDVSGSDNMAELNVRARGVMIRRLKKDVLHDLPAKRREIVLLESSFDDSDLLPDLSELNYEQAVAQLQSSKVAFAEWSNRRHEQGMAKVPFVTEHVTSMIADDDIKKVIVFAHHHDVIRSLCDDLARFNPALFTGKSNEDARNRAVNAFQNDAECKVFIGSIGAAGVGLTLTASSHVVCAEVDPVPGRMSQAEDRAHRIGQRDMVMVQHLVFDKTLDARICKILVKKQATLSALDVDPNHVIDVAADTERSPRQGQP